MSREAEWVPNAPDRDPALTARVAAATARYEKRRRKEARRDRIVLFLWLLVTPPGKRELRRLQFGRRRTARKLDEALARLDHLTQKLSERLAS